MSNHRFILPPTRFDKADRVLDFEGNEGVISEVFVSYPSRGNFADWTKPEIHYQVTFFNGPKRLHLEGELTDWVQTQLPFKNENPRQVSDSDAWQYQNM
jgi:hypothetical protein